MGKPTNTLDKALVGFLSLLAFKGRRVVIFRGQSNHVDRNPRAIRGRSRSLILVGEMKTFNQVGGKSRLIQVDSDG